MSRCGVNSVTTHRHHRLSRQLKGVGEHGLQCGGRGVRCVGRVNVHAGSVTGNVTRGKDTATSGPRLLTSSSRLSILTCMGSGHDLEAVDDKVDGDLNLATRAYLAQVGRRGGRAGRGKVKARPSAAMRRAARLRWERERRTRGKVKS